MQIDQTLVSHLANLSRLHYNPEEMEGIQNDLQAMIGFVEKLNELDTKGVEPLRHMSFEEDVFRQDIPGLPMAKEQSLQNAEAHDHHFFQVPKVIG